jgi:hypothetical protein
MGFGPLIDGASIDSTVAGALVVKTRAPTRDLAEALARALARPAR